MKNTNKDISNQELLEFIKENVAMKPEVATKTDLEQFATKEDLKEFKSDIIDKLDGVSKQLLDIQAENGANITAHKHFERRDEVFADKLDINLKALDAES